MVTVIGPHDRNKFRSGVVNTTSRAGWSSGLSPFLIGPCRLYGGYTSRNMENAWQYAKVYPQHANHRHNPTTSYWQWAKRGWANPRAVRYPMGKGAVPLYSLWDSEQLDYVSARKTIYIPLYMQAVRRTAAFARLSQMYREQMQLTLWDFDAYDHRALGYTWEDVIHDDSKKMGHGFVLAMMLEGYLK